MPISSFVLALFYYLGFSAELATIKEQLKTYG
jgi:hypothetical protein